MILVSACLVGHNTKYNGGNNRNEDVLEFLKDKEYILCCPEQLGGLSTPRLPAEIRNGDGLKVLEGEAEVININGENCTLNFIKGAEETLKLALKNNITVAILKSMSPSCGKACIYDGSFSNKAISGNGVTSQILARNGINVLTEDDVKKI